MRNTKGSAAHALNGRKIVILLVALSVAATFLTAFLRGPAAPGRQEAAKTRQAGADAGEIAALMQKVQQNPGDAESLSKLGELFSRAKDWPNAVHFWGKVIELDTGDDDAYYHRAHGLMELQRFDEALADYAAIIRLTPGSAVAHYYTAMIQKYEKDAPDIAREHLQKALAAQPKDKGLLAEINKELANLK